MNVLVSGIAGDIGLGIARVLKEWDHFDKLYGIDIHSDHPGLAILDECAIAPRATDSTYLAWLEKHINDNKIKVFIPTSEAEIKVLANESINSIGSAVVIRNNDFTVKNSLDKHSCLTYLASCGIEVPDHGLVGQDLPESYPVIVKPRFGQGSKGLAVVSTQQELSACQVGYVWQRYLLPEEEYTCPVYSSDATCPKVLLLKRKLVGGLTGSGIVVNNDEIESYVRRIVDCMQLNGAINIQLRLTEAGPLLFEINPRISSTVVFRDKLGFSDVRWWLSDKLGLRSMPYIAPNPGTRFYRGSQEYFFYN